MTYLPRCAEPEIWGYAKPQTVHRLATEVWGSKTTVRPDPPERKVRSVPGLRRRGCALFGSLLGVDARPLLLVRPLRVTDHAPERRVGAGVLGAPGGRQHDARGLRRPAAWAFVVRHADLLQRVCLRPVCARPTRSRRAHTAWWTPRRGSRGDPPAARVRFDARRSGHGIPEKRGSADERVSCRTRPASARVRRSLPRT
jgi:hypothetical protein